jgi:hypothetical protein
VIFTLAQRPTATELEIMRCGQGQQCQSAPHDRRIPRVHASTVILGFLRGLHSRWPLALLQRRRRLLL